MGSLRRLSTSLVLGLGLALMLTTPALAQFSDSYVFLKGVRDRDGDKVMEVLNKPGAPAINTRDPFTGEAALHIVVKRHDMQWLAFLLGKDANPNIKDRDGNTPLMLAAHLGDVESVRLLIQVGATVNAVNNGGETALILATQRRDPATVRLLTSSGADPRQRDTIAGKSAYDYAREDSRGTAIVKILDDAKPVAKPANVAGPTR